MRNAYRILAGISESNKILVDPEEYEDNIKMDLTDRVGKSKLASCSEAQDYCGHDS